MIITSRRSRAILSFGDMSTYEIGPDSRTVLDLVSREQSKLQLVMGRVWANLKKMSSGGTMEIEMGQACAGIKGTTLVVEEDYENKISTVKVLEGSVEVTIKESDKVISVESGQRLDVDSEQNYMLKEFNINEELENWSDLSYNTTKKAMEEAVVAGSSKTALIVILVLFFFALLFLAIGVFLLIKRKKQDVSVPVTISANKFCSNCGNQLEAHSVFCQKCGKKV